MKNHFCIFLFTCFGIISQAQADLDSLWNVWQDETQEDSSRFQALSLYTFNGYLFSDPDSAIYFADIHFDGADQKGDKRNMADALNNKGIAYYVKSDFDNAIDYFQSSLELFLELGDKKNSGNLYSNIGMINSSRGNYPMALKYLKQGLKIHEESENSVGQANTLNNIGLIYRELNDQDQALNYFEKSQALIEVSDQKDNLGAIIINIGLVLKQKGEYERSFEAFSRGLKIAEESRKSNWVANALLNLGLLHQQNEEFDQALDLYQRALLIREEMEDIGGISSARNNIGNLYNVLGAFGKARDECLISLELAERTEELETQKKSCGCLYKAYKGIGDGNNALIYHERLLGIIDSLNSEETAKQLQQMEFQKEMLADSLKQEEEKLRIEKVHQEEVHKKNKTKNIFLGLGLFLLLLAAGLFSRNRYIKRSKDIIEKEKDRSNNLLLNILPADIAEELKIHGKAEARDFDMVSILFTDFKGFTEASSKMSASMLVAEINTCFEAFDGIIEKYKVEKIKTIGDAYMAAGGLPVPTDDSVKNTVRAALEMQAFISKRKVEMDAQNKPAFEMRVGIHTGPVVAGIVGVKKFQYDIWGDTVNTASRVESKGETGKVNISQATYELLKDDTQFTFESRGKIQAKGKGEIEMYFVKSRN